LVREASGEESLTKLAAKVFFGRAKEATELRDDSLIELSDVIHCESLPNQLLPDERWQVNGKVGVCANANAHQYPQEVEETEIAGANFARIECEVVLASLRVPKHVPTLAEQPQVRWLSS
jgi:hypothetical protein